MAENPRVILSGFAQGPALLRRVHADGSYCSSNDLRVYFGLGDDRRAQRVTVRWPSGRTERFDGLPVGRQTDLCEGRGAETSW